MKMLSRSLWSIWSWFVFGACLVIWLPLMSVVWLVTAPFDPSRYWCGYLFRKLTVVHEKLNPLWDSFRNDHESGRPVRNSGGVGGITHQMKATHALDSNDIALPKSVNNLR